MTAAAQLQEIETAIAEARRAVAAGALIDLGGLDAAVAAMCEAARAVPPGEREALARGLASLAEALDQLATEIAHQREGALRQRANDAYGQEGPR